MRETHNVTQNEAVEQAMAESGGYSTLGSLYSRATRIESCKWGTKTPAESIRRIVQKDDRFFRIKPGLWGLSARRREILQTLGLTATSPPTAAAQSDHTYYQGLLAEIGELRGFSTYIPPQDSSRDFMGKKLSDITSLPKMLNFTYEHIVRRASTIDVCWFNHRQLPHALFEVENTTDIQSSLLKFLELQDFRATLCIVAPGYRHLTFDEKLAMEAFKPIKDLVKFRNYEQVAELHTAEWKRVSAAEACPI